MFFLEEVAPNRVRQIDEELSAAKLRGTFILFLVTVLVNALRTVFSFLIPQVNRMLVMGRSELPTRWRQTITRILFSVAAMEGGGTGLRVFLLFQLGFLEFLCLKFMFLFLDFYCFCFILKTHI